jgi:hypothetical protein
MPTYRISGVNKEGKPCRKGFEPEGYTPAQLKKIENDFKIYCKLGKDPKSFEIPPWYQMESIGKKDLEIQKSIKNKHFDTIHIDDLELPKNGAMSFACIGSTRSGKSYAVCHLYEKIFKKYVTFLMTLTVHGQIYKPFKKNGIIVEGFKSEFIDDGMKINKETNNHYNFCYILDDLVMEGKNDKTMTALLTVGRNFGCSAIISGQKLQMLSSTGRSNINFILAFKQNTETAIEDTIKTYLRSYFPKDMKINDMISMYKEMTSDHNFFLVNTLEDKCYISKI